MKLSIKAAAVLSSAVCAAVLCSSHTSFAETSVSSETEQPQARVFGDDVKVTYRGETFVLPINKDGATGEPSIKQDDYNFDGFSDIFIKTASVNREYIGDYWLWDDNAGEFVFSQYMAIENGRGKEMTIDKKEQTLHLTRNSKTVYYGWEGDAFVPKRAEVESKGQRMTYTFDDNYNTVLEKREKYDGIRHETVKELDTGDYLRVTDDAVEYMKGKSVIQSIPVSDIFPDTEPLKYSSLPAFKDELYGIKLVRMDLDFDGTRDLCVCLNPREQGEKPKYAYYLMNTKAGKLERMEELSEDGRLFTPDPFEKVLCHVETKFNEDHSTTANYYKWEGDKAILYKREEGDSEMTKVGRYDESMRVYRIDENGNEKLSRT